MQPVLKAIGNVLPNAALMFEGVVMQNLMGAQYVSLFPQPGKCYSVRIKELDAYRIVDARFDNNVLMLVGERHGSLRQVHPAL